MGLITSADKALFYAIQENDEMTVIKMLQQDPEIANRPLFKGSTTPLCRAVYNDFQPMVMILLDRGANIDLASTTSGRTPLMWAAFRGNIAILELLMEKGADKDLEDHEGLNAFDIAVVRL